MSAKQFLAQTHPFKVLPGAELTGWPAMRVSKRYDKGETIYSEGDPADSVWVLIKGRIQIFKYTSQGRPLAIESIAPGRAFRDAMPPGRRRAAISLHGHRLGQFGNYSDLRQGISREL